jgi:large subunit ribosomal protein L6
MSRIGRKLITVPKEAKVSIKEEVFYIEGPKGNLDLNLPNRITLELKDGSISVKRLGDSKLDRSLHGLVRALIVNMIKGVTEGYKKELEIIGVGYRASMQGKTLNMQLGFSHPVNFAVPEGIKIETPKVNQIAISGIDKQKVGDVAAKIRAVCPPEPYKGTGIRFVGEYVKKKAGKSQATTK